MANFGTTVFKGMIPRLEPHALPPGHAAYCENADLERGSLRPIKGVTQVTDLGVSVAARTIYKLGSTWLFWSGTRSAVKAEVADSDNRMFYTSGSLEIPRQTNATLLYAGRKRLGVKSPVDCYPNSSALTVALLGTGSGDVLRSVSYVYTYVDSFGSESAPSAPSAGLSLQAGHYVRLQNFQVPTEASCGSVIESLRVYRVETTDTGTADYMLIAARPVNLSATPVMTFDADLMTTTSISVYDANHESAPTDVTDQVGETLPSVTWLPLPDDASNLIQWQNGILAASADNEIFVSEPLITYAWPLAYRNVTQDNIVGLGVYRETLVIPTTSYPYVLNGSDPQNMTLEKLPYKQSCLSQLGVLSTDIGVAYPSPDGMYLLDGVQGKVITGELITKDQWNAGYYPSALLSLVYDDDLYGWRRGYATAFVMNLERMDNLRWLNIGSRYQVWNQFYDASSDILYLLAYDTTDETYRILSAFTNSTTLTYTWTSQVHRFDAPVSMSVARIFGTLSAGVTFKLYADGVLKSTQTVSSTTPFRLPGGFRAREWQVQISGSEPVTAYSVATSTAELP